MQEQQEQDIKEDTNYIDNERNLTCNKNFESQIGKKENEQAQQYLHNQVFQILNIETGQYNNLQQYDHLEQDVGIFRMIIKPMEVMNNNEGKNLEYQKLTQPQIIKIYDKNKREINKVVLNPSDILIVPGYHYYMLNQQNAYDKIVDLQIQQQKVKQGQINQEYNNKNDNQYQNVLLKIIQYDIIDSTMIIAEKISKNFVNKNNAILFIGLEQKQGKGQRQNLWQSPKGNFYGTFLSLFKMQELISVPQITAYSVFQTIRQFILNFIQKYCHKNEQAQSKIEEYLNINLKLKWINDIYFRNKKISGVLCQSEVYGQMYDDIYLRSGIGININNNPNNEISTSLKEEIIEIAEKFQLKQFFEDNNINDLNLDLRQIQKILSSNYFQNIYLLQKHGFKGYFQNKIDQVLEYKNQEVYIYDEKLVEVLHEGVFVGINEYGNAILEIQNNKQKIIVTDGRMRIKN